jgi:hypothetical protein
MVGTSAATVGAAPLVTAVIVPLHFGMRILSTRLEADPLGIRCSNA